MNKRGKIILGIILLAIVGISIYLPLYWNYLLPNQGFTTDKEIRSLDLINGPDANDPDNLSKTISYESYYPRPPRPHHLYAINTSDCQGEELVTLMSLQGILAKTEPRIYISDDAYYGKWVNLIRSQNITVEEVHDAWGLIGKFANETTGYIVYKKDTPGDMPADSIVSLDSITYKHKDESYLVAVSLSGILNACVIEEEDIPKIEALGLSMVFDARGKDVDWLFSSDYWSKLRHDMIFEVEHHSARRYCLIDYAIFAGAPVWHAQDQDDRAEYLKHFDVDSPAFGWGAVPGDEGSLNLQVTIAGGFFMPSDWSRDLSVFSAIPVICKQKPLPDFQVEDNVHYVTILMSDGDNLQWLMGDFDSEKYFGNEHVGDFPMGWMMPPAMADLCPLILQYYYDKASATDRFIAGNSGHGLIYPSRDHWRETHISRSKGIFDRADVNIVVIQDYGWTADSFEDTTALPNVKGIFYNDYRQYALQSGKIMWTNDKPAISMTYNFWVGFDSASGIASSINSGSKNIHSSKAYSVIVVHAWTHNMDDVASMVKLFNDNVRVVDPETFISIFTSNVAHINVYNWRYTNYLIIIGVVIIVVVGYKIWRKKKHIVKEEKSQ